MTTTSTYNRKEFRHTQVSRNKISTNLSLKWKENKENGLKVGRTKKPSEKFKELEQFRDFIIKNIDELSLNMMLETLTKKGLSETSRTTLNRYIAALSYEPFADVIKSKLSEFDVDERTTKIEKDDLDSICKFAIDKGAKRVTPANMEYYIKFVLFV